VAKEVKKSRGAATADLIQQYEGKLALLKTWESVPAELIDDSPRPAIQMAAMNQTFCVINSFLCLSALAGVISSRGFLFRKVNSITSAGLYRVFISDQPRDWVHESRTVNDCSTHIAFAWNTGSTPGASKTFQPQACGLISIYCHRANSGHGCSTSFVRRWVEIIRASSRNAVSFSSARTTNLFPSSRCASAIQMVRPSAFTAETQPQLQPDALSLSAMISPYFILCRAWLLFVKQHG
jgi:hypothetical protein